LDSYAHGLAAIVDKKLIYAFESDSRFLKNPGVLNAIISHEPVAINPKNKPEFQYKPRCSVMFAMNEIPGAANPDSGIFRRVKVVTVPSRSAAKRDPTVRDTIEHDEVERSGILNLMLAGLAHVRANGGLEVPDSVAEKTEEWHLANDKVGTFIRRRCVTDPTFEVPAADLYSEFRRYCRQTGARVLGQQTFGKRLSSRGFERRKSHGRTVYVGIDLAPPGDDDEEDDDGEFGIDLGEMFED